MYERIIKNAPYGTYAPQCQFNIGLAREQQRKFTDAVDAYQKVLDNYPTSSVAANAQYQIGYAWMRSSVSGDYDMGAAKKAVDAFQDFLVRYPVLPRLATARALTSAQSVGHRLCISLASTPLARCTSVGKYSPKSAIQPDSPWSSMLAPMMSSANHAAAFALVKSTVPHWNSPKSTSAVFPDASVTKYPAASATLNSDPSLQR